MVKKFFLSLLALFVPWSIFLIKDNLAGALITLLLQSTFIGWLPASVWAWRVLHYPPQEASSRREDKKE